MSSDSVWDPGLQPERTHLSWRRTALSVAAGSLIALRVLPLTFHAAVWIIPGLVGVLAAAGIWLIGELRYRAFVRQLDERVPGTDPIPPGGAGIFTLMLFVTLVGLVALVTVVVRG